MYVAVKKLDPENDKDRNKISNDWEREAESLQKMNSLRHPNIVRFIGAFRRGDKGREDHYLMFEWADGGNLRSLWENSEVRDHLTPMLMKDAVKQIRGLATALSGAHDFESLGVAFRHGDLTPKNILWFKPKETDAHASIGTLKITDLGLAKQHTQLTHLRMNGTSNPGGTKRYAPPEEAEDVGQSSDALETEKPIKVRSRLYDVWAMGCITLEFIVWLRYGSKGLKAFNEQILNEDGEAYPAPFYIARNKRNRNGKKIAEVHPTVVWWMNHMAEDSAFQQGTALRDLLDLVRDRLLVVKLPPTYGASFGLSSSMKRGSPSRSSREPGSRETTPLQTPHVGAVGNINPNTPLPKFSFSGPKEDEHPAQPIQSPTCQAASERGRAPGPRHSESLTQSSSQVAPRALSEHSKNQGRALAEEFERQMDYIVSDENDTDAYWLSWDPNQVVSKPEYPQTERQETGDTNANEALPEAHQNGAVPPAAARGLGVPGKVVVSRPPHRPCFADQNR